MKHYSLCLAGILLNLSVSLFAQSTVTINGKETFIVDGIYYQMDIIDAIVVHGESFDSSPYAGDISIPATVRINGKTREVRAIADSAFYNSSALTSVTLPEGLYGIGAQAFGKCVNLSTITVPSTLSDMTAANAMNGTAWLESQPDGMVYLGHVALRWKGAVPEGATLAFKEGTRHLAIDALNVLVEEGDYPDGLPFVALHIPASMEHLGGQYLSGCDFAHCPHLASITVDEKNTTFDSRDNCNAIIQSKGQYLVRGCKNTVIPEGVEEIYNGAFWGCSALEAITIPSTVTHIFYHAFYGCTNLRSVTCKALLAPWMDAGPVYPEDHRFFEPATTEEGTLYVYGKRIKNYTESERSVGWSWFEKVRPIEGVAFYLGDIQEQLDETDRKIEEWDYRQDYLWYRLSELEEQVEPYKDASDDAATIYEALNGVAYDLNQVRWQVREYQWDLKDAFSSRLAELQQQPDEDALDQLWREVSNQIRDLLSSVDWTLEYAMNKIAELEEQTQTFITTAVGALKPRMSEGGWYRMDGTRLDKRPLKRGVYVHDGRKMVVE